MMQQQSSFSMNILIKQVYVTYQTRLAQLVSYTRQLQDNYYNHQENMELFYYLVKIAAITLQIVNEFHPSPESDLVVPGTHLTVLLGDELERKKNVLVIHQDYLNPEFQKLLSRAFSIKPDFKLFT